MKLRLNDRHHEQIIFSVMVNLRKKIQFKKHFKGPNKIFT